VSSNESFVEFLAPFFHLLSFCFRGVGQNIERAIPSLIQNVKALGGYFADHMDQTENYYDPRFARLL
jgi:hypothetical protein